MLTQNVVKLNNSIVFEQIQKYLDKHGYNSEKTREAYLSDIKLFFKVIKDKEIQYLNVEDMQLTLDDFEDFIGKLYNAKDNNGEKIYSNSTINRKVKGVRGLMKYLAAKKIVEDVSYLGLIENLPENVAHHGILDTQEVFELAELARQERNKGEIKRLAILFSFDTCVRKSEMLSLKWSDLVVKEDEGIVLVKGIGKGNKEFRQTISLEFYNELLKLKEDGVDHVFQISGKRLNDMMSRLVTKMGIPEERRIVWHSIRKAGGTFRYRISGGDIMAAKKALNHSSISTTQLYIQEIEYGVMGAVSSGGELDTELYKKTELDVLREAISKAPKNIQMIVNLKIKDIIKQNNYI